MDKIEEESIKKAGKTTVEVPEKIRRHVARLMIYLNEQEDDYKRCLADEPRVAEDHVWLHIKEIGEWIGLTFNEAEERYE